MKPLTAETRDNYVSRYQSGEWRATIFADMVLDDLQTKGPGSTVVDIGCGAGFDGSQELQQRIAERAGTYIGIEPDSETVVGPHFSQVHRTLFEDAPIAEASVDIAFSVMVAEHVEQPHTFLSAAARVLKDDGVFWAFTIDLRHWGTWVSLLMEKTQLKDTYLNILAGKRGVDRYNNFPVQYRMNTPAQVKRHTQLFQSQEFINLTRIGAEDPNLPRVLRPVNHAVDHVLHAVGAPGSNLAFRLVRAPR